MKLTIKMLLTILSFPFFILRIVQACWEISGVILDDLIEWLEEEAKEK